MTPRTSIIAIALVTLGSAWIVGDGTGGLTYAACYALAAAVGLPLGFKLFGRRQAAGWVAGALIGYVLTAFGLWAAIAAGVPSRVWFLVAWLAAGASTWGLGRRRHREPLIALPAWDAHAGAALVFVLLLTLALAVPPFARIGERDQSGNRYYRAYFTADFVWHTALTAELAKFSMPPRNPYLAPEPIHYYWTYFLLPAVVSQAGPSSVRSVESCLKVNATLTGLLLISSVFMLAWTTTRRPWVTAAAVSLALLAGSFEGTYEIYRLWTRGQSLSALRDTNIDAIADWHFGGHRIDGLPRCLWYVPQHSMAYALGLVSLTAVAASGATGSSTAIALEGLVLAGAVAINPFVGGIFAFVWGLSVLLDALRTRASVATVARHAVATIPVGLALVWCISSKMVEGAGGVLEIGLKGASLHAPLWTLFLSLGPVLLPVLAACALLRPDSFRVLVPAILLSATALAVMYFLRLRVDVAWVAFRAGQMFLVSAPALIGYGLSVWLRSSLRIVAATAFGVLLLLGLPTTIVDAYNAQDITNRSLGAGFHWTVVLSPDQQQALNWIRRATPHTAIVQMEPEVRGREEWSLIPSFGERRMAGGLPISLMSVPEYQQRSDRIREMFASPDSKAAQAIAHELHIDYVYVDGLDRDTYPGAIKFDSSPEQFVPAFKRGAVGVYRVQ
jgi:hypothetical protein